MKEDIGHKMSRLGLKAKRVLVPDWWGPEPQGQDTSNGDDEVWDSEGDI